MVNFGDTQNLQLICYRKKPWSLSKLHTKLKKKKSTLILFKLKNIVKRKLWFWYICRIFKLGSWLSSNVHNNIKNWTGQTAKILSPINTKYILLIYIYFFYLFKLIAKQNGSQKCLKLQMWDVKSTNSIMKSIE